MRRFRDERGQAMTETVLLTWILLVFIAAIYQLFLINQSVYSSLSVVHTKLFESAFQRNCADSDTARCGYSTAARVIWTPKDVPEISIPAVGMFQADFPSDLRLESIRYGYGGYDYACPDRACKRTKVGSGTYKNPLTGLAELPGIVASDGYLSGYLDGLDMYLLNQVVAGLIDSIF